MADGHSCTPFLQLYRCMYGMVVSSHSVSLLIWILWKQLFISTFQWNFKPKNHRKIYNLLCTACAGDAFNHREQYEEWYDTGFTKDTLTPYIFHLHKLMCFEMSHSCITGVSAIFQIIWSDNYIQSQHHLLGLIFVNMFDATALVIPAWSTARLVASDTGALVWQSLPLLPINEARWQTMIIWH